MYSEKDVKEAFVNLLGNTIDYELFRESKQNVEVSCNDFKFIPEHKFYLYNSICGSAIEDVYYEKLYKVVETKTKNIELYIYEAEFPYGYANYNYEESYKK